MLFVRFQNRFDSMCSFVNTLQSYDHVITTIIIKNIEIPKERRDQSSNFSLRNISRMFRFINVIRIHFKSRKNFSVPFI